MQVFVCYPEPIKVAQCLDSKRLNKQIIECRQILDAIDGKGKGWFNHPVTKMYKPYSEWLYCYMKCLECYVDYINHVEFRNRNTPDSYFTQALFWNSNADRFRPPFLTEDFCNQHKRRLFTKNPEHYRQFAEYGKSDENWYCIDGEIVKYVNGKRL